MRRGRLTLVAALVAAGLVTACGPTPAASTQPAASSSAAASSPAGTTSPGAASSPAAASSSASSGTVGQTDTDWGRIWDTVPSGFPMYAGATRSDEAQAGPSSGVYVIPGHDARAVATWYADALRGASFTVDGNPAPLENGGFVVDASGAPAGCRLELSVAPLGDLTSVTVLYGAACRH